MTDFDDPDRELRRRFAELRASESTATPPLARVMAGRPARRARRVWRGAAVVLGTAAAITVAIVLEREDGRSTPTAVAPAFAFAATPGSMRVPTDFLLEAVPMPRAGDVPAIGEIDWSLLDFSGAAALDDSSRRE